MAEAKEKEFEGKTLVRIERQVRDHYTALRRERGPAANYTPSAKNDVCWQRTAEQILRTRANPYTWVEAQFENCPVGKYPHPNNMYGESAQERYLDYVKEFAGLPSQEVHCMTFYLHNLTTRAEWPEKEVFLSWHMDDLFKPYFKVLFCPEELLPAMMEKHGERAIAEIEANPSLKEYLTNNYADRAKRIIRQELPAEHAGPPHPVPPPSPPVSRREGGPRRLLDSNPQGDPQRGA